MSQKRNSFHDSLISKPQMKMLNRNRFTVWQNLPNLIFGDIMMMAGLNSLDNLQKCRQVCQSWNMMIAQTIELKKKTIMSEAESQADQIVNKFEICFIAFLSPGLPEIVTAASLAHHGLLGPVICMDLNDVDLASIPAEHLASLASCVTEAVSMRSVNCDISNILRSIRCRSIRINNQRLSSEETRDLVRAMETTVESLYLAGTTALSLDIETLTQYAGEGRCELVCSTDGGYKEELMSWAQKINWDVNQGGVFKFLQIRRK